MASASTRRRCVALSTPTLGQVLREATLKRRGTAFGLRGGRAGVHSEHIGHLLAEMQFLQRAYPDARW